MCLCVCNLDPVAYAFDCSHTGVLERIHVARTRQVFCSARKIRRRRSCCARSFCARSHGPMTTTTTQRAVVTTRVPPQQCPVCFPPQRCVPAQPCPVCFHHLLGHLHLDLKEASHLGQETCRKSCQVSVHVPGVRPCVHEREASIKAATSFRRPMLMCRSF